MKSIKVKNFIIEEGDILGNNHYWYKVLKLYLPKKKGCFIAQLVQIENNKEKGLPFDYEDFDWITKIKKSKIKNWREYIE